MRTRTIINCLGCRRNVARRLFGPGSEEELLHLACQVLTCSGIGQVQPVLVDEHRLVLLPELEGFLADVVVDALTEFTGVGREAQALGLLLQINTLHHAGHTLLLDQPSFLTSTCERRSQLYFRLRASGSQSGSTCTKPRLM